MSSLIGWTDMIDIFIVFLILYGVYLSIRGTRAVPLLIGVASLAFFGALAKSFRLRTLDFLFSNVWSVGLIFLAVVFQPEIRSGLANIGQRRFWPLFSELKSETIINTLIDATESLKKREVGALIAVEQEVGLKDYIETGTEINASLNSEILLTLFMSKGPLHDGGVVVRDNSLVGAGCIFPLSDRTDLTQQFGTRHRAAVGLGEESDAVIIVVSEETGEITFVYRSKIETDLTVEELEDLLYEHLAQ
jgi:diadenylate cyclase